MKRKWSFLLTCLFAAIAIGCLRSKYPALEKYSPNAAVVSKEIWPPFFRDIERFASSRGLNTDSFKLHEVAADEFFFECTASEELFAVFLSEWALIAVSENNNAVKRFLRRMPDGFGKTEATSFFVNPNVFDGEGGVLLTMSRTGSTGVTIVHYYYKF